MATTFPLQIDDTSPLIAYAPFGDTLALPNPSAGWNPYYQTSGYVTQPNMVGVGASSHRTAHDGATLTLRWIGTAIQLYGSATAASYTVTLNGTIQDGTTARPEQGLLFEVDDLPNQDHLLVLTAHVNSTMSLIEFDRAVVTASTMVNGSIVSMKPMDIAHASLYGSWDQVDDLQLGLTYFMTDASGDTVSWEFNGTAITVEGIRDQKAGDYTVTLDGNVFNYSAASSASEVTLLFMQSGLAPDSKHEIIFTNSGDGTLALSASNVTSSSGGTPIVNTSSTSSTTPSATASVGYSKGTIAAIALAGILGALFLIMLGVYLWRRERRKIEALRREESRFSIPPDMTGVPDQKRPVSTAQTSLPPPPPVRHSRQYLGHTQLGTTKARNVTTATLGSGFSQIHPYSSRDADIEARYQNWYKDEEASSPPTLDLPTLPLAGQAPADMPVPGPSRPRQTSSNSSIAKIHKKGMSFLDFASSASSSLRRSRSRSTRSHVASTSKSVNSQSNSNSNSSRRGKHRSGGQFSMSISVGDGPFPMSDEGGEYATAHVSASRRQSRMRSNSPTDSVPMTVSEIAFRQESGSDEDRRLSGSHLPPHPPLPNPLGSPRIVQMLLGRVPPVPSPLTPGFRISPQPPDSAAPTGEQQYEGGDWVVLPETNRR